MECDEGGWSLKRERTHPSCHHQRSEQQLLALEWNDQHEKRHSHVQGPWGLSVEALAEAQGPAPQPGSVVVLAWAGCTPCMVQPDLGSDPAWAACKERMVQPNSGAGPA